MRRLLLLALGASALLATTSAQAHSHPRMPKGLALSVAHTFHVAPDSVTALASPTTGPTFHVSSRSSYSGFRSTPSRSYSAPATRSYSAPATSSFRSSSPSISTRPATTSAPHTYTYSISGVPRTKTYTPAPSSPPTEVHHYYAKDRGGPSVTELILLNEALNNNRQQSNATSAGTSRFVSDVDEAAPAVTTAPDDGFSGWQVVGFVLLFCALVGGFGFLVIRLAKDE